MDEELKKILEDVRQSVESLARSANEITDYLAWMRSKVAERESAPLTFIGPRSYLAGRQPRRDGDSYGIGPVPTTGGAHGTQAKDQRQPK